MTGYHPTPADVEWLTQRSETDRAWKQDVVDLLVVIAKKPPVAIKR